MADYSLVPFALLSRELGKSRIRQQEQEDLGSVFRCSSMLWDLDAEGKKCNGMIQHLLTLSRPSPKKQGGAGCVVISTFPSEQRHQKEKGDTGII